MFVLHIALQGCLRAHDVEYGITADTGGHIRYLLDLVAASARNPSIDRMEIVTRAFRHAVYAECYGEPVETIDATTRIVRLRSASDAYLTKEELWSEHESLIDELAAHIASLDRRPDMLHAHYADAGAVAARVSAMTGIPYVFTAHSLGRVKREAFDGDCAETADLDRRIAFEEAAMTGAAAIIASSRDEAELQYAGYAAYDPGRIRVLPPGSDLARFSPTVSSAPASAAIDRFLTDPDKPAILAIARPVTKKNLSALLHAYGGSPALRDRANLVLLAGTRDDIAELEPESRGNLGEILALIDRYDLYGHIAYPKTHSSDDIPAFYSYARERRGVFVNPALNEPFGLTLLEAAASGLPVVATDSGGPNDIIEHCGNGVLVDPRSIDGIAAAVLAMLDDGAKWSRHAAAGDLAVKSYDWDRHVALYAGLLREIVAPQPPAATHAQLLVTDIDGTLIGCADSVDAFCLWHEAHSDVAFAVATGRSFHSAMAVLAQQEAPRPEIMITSVGSEIYYRDPSGGTYTRDAEWDAIIAAGWDRASIAAIMRRDGGLTAQAPLEQRRCKLSYFADGDPTAAARVKTLLERHGHSCSIIQSHGRYLDILPLGASKGTAVEHVRQKMGLTPRQVFVAGDSGNDIEMLRVSPHAIIVGNYSDDLAAHPDLAHGYVAVGHHARGIIEGVTHFPDPAPDGARVSGEPSVSVLTLARGRRGHLVNLIAGLAAQTVQPAELVIAFMQPSPEPDLPATDFPIRSIIVPGDAMPLAAARNRAAAAASGDELVFLDVDCIPSPTLVARYRTTAGTPGGVRLGEVAYLPPMGPSSIDMAALNAAGTRHPAKPGLAEDECRRTPDHGELWGLSFALSAADWRAAGGMDEAYVGYGAEETDFAARLERAGVGMWWIGGARAYHQHHSVHIPPLQHFAAIVRNATLFRERWGRWCMDYWLGQFARAGWIAWDDDAITILRHPSPAEIAAARQPDTVLFS